MSEPLKHASGQGDLSPVDRQRAEYRKTLSRRELFKKVGKTAAAVVATSMLPGLPNLPFSSAAEAGGGFGSEETQKRFETLQTIPGNQNAIIVKDIVRDADGTTSSRPSEIFRELASKEFDWTYEFKPEDSTWHFIGASMWTESPDDSAFLNSSGRIPVVQEFERKLDDLPPFIPLLYHPGDAKLGLVYGQHALIIPKTDVPPDGYVAVFARPDKPEGPKAFFDRWELDTGFFSGGVRVKGGHHAQNVIGDGYFLTIGTQDRTDRLTPFYNRDNSARVEKAVVIFDKFGQPVKKFNLKTTEFKFDDPNYKGNEKAAKENISFPTLHSLTDNERVEWMNSLLGRGGAIKADTKELRLHWVLENPNYLQVHMLMSERSTTNRYPIEMRVTRRQWEDLKKRFKTVTQDSKESFSFPGDLIVPEGTDLNFRVDVLARGDFPGAQFLMLVLLNVKP